MTGTLTRLIRHLALPSCLTVACTLAQGAPLPSRVEQIPVTIDGESVHLQMRIYKPAGQGKFPTLVFNHGSTGFGMDSTRFTKSVDVPAVAAFFVQRGWAVVIPARRGRAGSEGQYDEGFSIVRALGYSCIPSRSLAGADRALRDIDAAMSAILQMPFVDIDRVVIGGVSRGGALSVAYAGTHPSQVRGVINFVGGWLGMPCPTMGSVNQSVLNRGSAFPGESIWLYADNDSYYSLSHSRDNFAAFTAAGGKGLFYELAVPAENGHWILGFPAVWATQVEAYLEHLGLPIRVQGDSPPVAQPCASASTPCHRGSNAALLPH